MPEADLTLAAMAEELAKSADYRVLRRLVRREASTPSIGQSTKTGILLDVETTGLDQQKDEVIELGMLKFDFLPDGRIAGLRDVFSSFNDPSAPVPPEVIALTGVTNEMKADLQRSWLSSRREARRSNDPSTPPVTANSYSNSGDGEAATSRDWHTRHANWWRLSTSGNGIGKSQECNIRGGAVGEHGLQVELRMGGNLRNVA